MNMRITIRSLIVTLFVLAGGLAFNLQAAHADHVITPDEYKLFQEGMRCHHEGDYPEALSCWIPLAETGVAEAQYNVGRMYGYGEGVAQNYVEAYAWFILSARNGRIEGRTALDELKPHMSPAEIARAYERASELEVYAEWPGS
jgi:TPR repeat protein